MNLTTVGYYIICRWVGKGFYLYFLFIEASSILSTPVYCYPFSIPSIGLRHTGEASVTG